MGVIQLPGVLLCDDSITGGILIVSAIGSNQMPLSVTRKAGAIGECFPFCSGCVSQSAGCRVRGNFESLHDACLNTKDKQTNCK